MFTNSAQNTQLIHIDLPALTGCDSFQEAQKAASPTRGLEKCSEKYSIGSKNCPQKYISDPRGRALSLDILSGFLIRQMPCHACLPSLHPSQPPPSLAHPPWPQNEENVIRAGHFSDSAINPWQFHFNIDQLCDDN